MMTSLLGWLIAAASSVTLFPILFRIVRHRDGTGVSASTASLGTLAMLSWTSYTLSLRDWPAVASSVGPLVIWYTVLVSLFVLRRDLLTGFLLAATALVSVAAWLFVAPSVLAYTAVAGSISWSVPQLRLALGRGSLSGVSAVGYFFVFVENFGWVLYAVGTGHYAYAIAPVVQGPAAALIAWRAHRSHGRD